MHTETLQAIAQFQPIDGNWLPLEFLLQELWSTDVPPAAESLPILFAIFERFPDEDGNGVFWSIVHGVESLPYNYASALRQSHARVPSLMNDIMLTRIANAEKAGTTRG